MKRSMTGRTKAAIWVNGILLLAALILPRTLATGTDTGFESAAGAAMLFAIPMTLILIIGVAVILVNLTAARRDGRRMPVIAFVPVLFFFVGLAIVMVLINTGVV